MRFRAAIKFRRSGSRPAGARKRHPFLALAFGIMVLALPFAASAEECPAGNLVPAARITGIDLRGQVRAVADSWVADEGAPWDSPLAVVLAGAGASVSVDLGAVTPLSSLMIQADGDDYYLVDGSRDNATFFPICRVRPFGGGGLRTRRVDLGGINTRYLRVTGSGGNGRYSIAELEAVCRASAGPAHFGVVLEPPREGWLSSRLVLAVKLATALLAAALFLYGWLLRRRGRPGAHNSFRDRVLMVLGIAGVLCWWNLGAFHFYNYRHPGELFHYFLGAKYFEELGYDGLYRCTAAADAEAGLESRVRDWSYRDLGTKKDLVSGAAMLEQAGECTQRFSPGRWREFKLDVAWFRSWVPPLNWMAIMQDHGYNASPAWWLAGSLLTCRLQASDLSVLALALIDPLLLIGMLALLVRVFGWRAAAVAAIWWGTNLPADFSWTGGGFLRQDWLLLTVAGVCLVRKERWAAGGAVIAFAALLRIYPLFLAAGLGCKALACLVQRRSLALERGHRRFACGFLASSVLIVLLSAAVSPHGVDSWTGFLKNGRTLLSANATNYVGLPTLLSYDPAALLRKVDAASFWERVSLWREQKERVLASRLWARLALTLLLVGLLLARVRAVEDWEALVLGVGLIPFAVSSSSYYASIYLLYGLLWERYKERVALPLVALAGLTQLGLLVWGQASRQEELFAWVSLWVVSTVLWMTALRRS